MTAVGIPPFRITFHTLVVLRPELSSICEREFYSATRWGKKLGAIPANGSFGDVAAQHLMTVLAGATLAASGPERATGGGVPFTYT